MDFDWKRIGVGILFSNCKMRRIVLQHSRDFKSFFGRVKRALNEQTLFV
jgi:hypothetical protein